MLAEGIVNPAIEARLSHFVAVARHPLYPVVRQLITLLREAEMARIDLAWDHDGKGRDYEVRCLETVIRGIEAEVDGIVRAS